jgi:outer membrane protein OmpA-like peptidoglycan-associated protein
MKKTYLLILITLAFSTYLFSEPVNTDNTGDIGFIFNDPNIEITSIKGEKVKDSIKLTLSFNTKTNINACLFMDNPNKLDYKSQKIYYFLNEGLKNGKNENKIDFTINRLKELNVLAIRFIFNSWYNIKDNYAFLNIDDIRKLFGEDVKLTKQEKNFEKLSVNEKKEKVLKDKITEFKNAEKGDMISFSNIIFYSDKDTIKEESYYIIDQIAQVLSERSDIKIELIGNTNNTGNPQAEMVLSKMRADMVKKYLINKGIAGERMSTTGNGSTFTKGSTIDESNRKVVIKISY